MVIFGYFNFLWVCVYTCLVWQSIYIYNFMFVTHKLCFPLMVHFVLQWNLYVPMILQFQMHCGWIFAAFLLNVNLMFIAYGATVLLQIFLASLSLALIVDATMYSLIRLPDSRPNYTIPSVFVWTTVSLTIFEHMKN